MPAPSIGRPRERGNIVLIIAAVLAMLSVGGLAIDLGRALHERRSIKTAADASVLAALQYIKDQRPDDRVGKFTEVATAYMNANGLLPSATLSVTHPVAGYDADAWKVTITEDVPTSLLRLIRDHITVSASSTAYVRTAPVGIVALDKGMHKAVSLRGHTSLHMKGGMVFVNSDEADALSLVENSTLETGGNLQLVGGAAVSSSSSLDGSSGPGAANAVAHSATQINYSPGDPPKKDANQNYVEPLAFLYDLQVNSHTAGATADTMDAPTAAGGGTFKIQCGKKSGCDNVRLIIKTANGLTHAGQSNYWPNWNASCTPSWTGGGCAVGDPTGQPDADGEFKLCPGVYYGGMTVVGAKVHLLTCQDAACAGKCGTNREPIFIFAGGLRVRNSTTVNASDDSPTKVYGEGVVVYQGKNPGGSYGRIMIDRNSDFEISPPTSGPYKGVAVFTDPEYTGPTQLSARALGGIVGDIYTRGSRLIVSGKRREKCRDENGNVTRQGCHDLGQITASIVARAVRFGGGTNDDGDSQCDSTEKCSSDATGACSCTNPDWDGGAVHPQGTCCPWTTDESGDDPEVVFEPGSTGASGLQVVLGE